MMLKTSRTVAACCVLLAIVAASGGCGKKAKFLEASRTPVTGVVMFDGKPIGGGNITLVSAKDPTCMTMRFIKADGTFKVGNAPHGEVLVAVETESAKIGNPSGYVKIPRRYASVKTSKLKIVIPKSEGEEPPKPLVIELTSK